MWQGRYIIKCKRLLVCLSVSLFFRRRPHCFTLGAKFDMGAASFALDLEQVMMVVRWWQLPRLHPLPDTKKRE